MPAPQPSFWKRKLAAYLHDPPEKAFDFGPRHMQRAEIYAASFGVSELWKTMTGTPDWSAAAADRFVFPHGSKVGSLAEDLKIAFVHPIGGRAENRSEPTLPMGSLEFPSQPDAEQWLSDVKLDWHSNDPYILFMRAWRLWSDRAASHATGSGKGAELIPYLPADTRVPDGSIWHHCAVVSALEVCRTSDDLKAPLDAAFLLFQVGPVQEFISQARSTRDSWSGSYLLSWLMIHAIKAVADRCGPDAVIFPSLKGQPLYDWLEREKFGIQPDESAVLVPGIPNRFLAIVPGGFDAAAIADAFQAEWKVIAEFCRQWLNKRGIAVEERLWTEQIERFWQITWQCWPWQNADEALASFRALPLGANNGIHLAKTIAEGIPDAHKDSRCYRHGKLDPGWAWSAHYQLCQHALDARRGLRDFQPFTYKPTRKSGHRDCLSGREEAVVQADKIEAVILEDIKRLFRHAEPLGAANLIKRVWHKAYLEQEKELKRARESFDSVSAVAGGTWLEGIRQRLGDDGELWVDLIGLSEVLAKAKPHLRGIAIPNSINRVHRSDESQWIKGIDGEVFTARFWELLDSGVVGERSVKDAASAIAAFKAKHKLGEPSPYYAVLALDGDQIGKWLSGEKSPAVKNVLTAKATEYFRQNLPKDQVETWLASPRPISPSWHLQFSEALANFSLYAVRRIVEDVHHGQLIYAGGDDVLAMLPADEAISCATDLRAAFQGRHGDMSRECQRLFAGGVPEGFIQLAAPRRDARNNPVEPSWPILVPGPRMTVSVGIAIGHSKEPLQDIIQAAQIAEKRAKAPPERLIYSRSEINPAMLGAQPKPSSGWDRDALAVTLFKRSGETIEWGTKFSSKALSLLDYLRQHFRPAWDRPATETAISGRFPYRLAGLLGVYEADKPLTAELRDIALKEFEHVIGRQTITNDRAMESVSTFRREDFCERGAKYLEELLNFEWCPPSGEPGELTPAPRPLRQFINLFLLEAFIRRQAD